MRKIPQFDEDSQRKYHQFNSDPALASVSASAGENIKHTKMTLDREVVDIEAISAKDILVKAGDTIYPNINKKFFIETHGCQMNLADSEVIRSVLLTEKYVMCDVLEDADLILTNTCSIRYELSLVCMQTFIFSVKYLSCQPIHKCCPA